MIELLFWITPVASIIALLFAWFFFRGVLAAAEGTERMQTIARHVRVGAMAYLRQEYKVDGIFFVWIFLLFAFLAYGLRPQNL